MGEFAGGLHRSIPGMRGTSYGRRLIALDYPDRESNRLTAAFHFYGTWEPICASDACAERLELSPFSMLSSKDVKRFFFYDSLRSNIRFGIRFSLD